MSSLRAKVWTSSLSLKVTSASAGLGGRAWCLCNMISPIGIVLSDGTSNDLSTQGLRGRPGLYCSIDKNVNPAAKISTVLWYWILPYLSFFQNSGALKERVPTSEVILDVSSFGSRNFERPKSPSLTSGLPVSAFWMKFVTWLHVPMDDVFFMQKRQPVHGLDHDIYFGLSWDGVWLMFFKVRIQITVCTVFHHYPHTFWGWVRHQVIYFYDVLMISWYFIQWHDFVNRVNSYASLGTKILCCDIFSVCTFGFVHCTKSTPSKFVKFVHWIALYVYSCGRLRVQKLFYSFQYRHLRHVGCWMPIISQNGCTPWK